MIRYCHGVCNSVPLQYEGTTLQKHPVAEARHEGACSGSIVLQQLSREVALGSLVFDKQELSRASSIAPHIYGYPSNGNVDNVSPSVQQASKC